MRRDPTAEFDLCLVGIRGRTIRHREMGNDLAERSAIRRMIGKRSDDFGGQSTECTAWFGSEVRRRGEATNLAQHEPKGWSRSKGSFQCANRRIVDPVDVEEWEQDRDMSGDAITGGGIEREP